MITVTFGPPCRCQACLVAGVSERSRPIRPDLHGRDLARWLASYDQAREALARMRMPAAIGHRTPDEAA